MGTLTIKRKKQFGDFIYNYKVFIDRVEVAEISSGQTLLINIENNDSHSIYVKQKFVTSSTTIFKVDDEIILEAGMANSKLFIGLIFAATLIILSNLVVVNTKFTDFSRGFFFSIYLTFFLTLVFNRKTYLSIKEVKKNNTI